MPTQLETQRAINALVTEKNVMLKEQTTLLKEELKLSIAIQKVFEGGGPKEATDAINEMNAALEEASEQAAASQAAGEQMASGVASAMLKALQPIKSFRGMVEKLKDDWPAVSAGVAGFADGFISSFKFITNTLTAVTGLVGSIITGFMDVGKSILAIPVKFWEGMIQISNRFVAMMEAVARATEEVRTQFGDLATGPGAAVMTMSRGMGEAFEKTGLTAFRVFGNMAERIQAVNKLATGMGASFEAFRDELKGPTGAAVMLLQRGLGLSGEQMGGVARRAKAMGTSVTKQLEDVTNFSVEFGEAFGFSAKTISRDVGTMLADVKNFGNLGPKELTKIAVATKALGIETKDLLGMIDKYDTFEGAATSAAMMSQAFGVQVDAMKMMRAESPIDRLEELRRAFRAGSQDVDTMNRQQLKYLAQQTGMSEETLRTALSQKNLGVSMADLEKQGKISEKRQLSTAEAMQKVSSAIERVIKPFKRFEGIWKAFTDGFARGIFTQKEFRKALEMLNRALKVVMGAGIKVGRMFVEIFPGIMPVITSFKEFLDLGKDSKLQAFLDSVVASFKTFFEALAGNKPGSLKTLMSTIKKSFWNFLMKGETESGKIEKGVKDFLTGVGRLVGEFVYVITDGIEQGVDILVGLMTGEAIPDVPGSSFAHALIDPITEALQNVWPQIVTAFDTLWAHAWPKIKKKGKAVLKEFGPWLALVLFGPAVIKGLLAFGTTALMKGVMGTVGEVAKKAAGISAEAVPGAKAATENLAGVATGAGGVEKAGRKVNFANLMKILLALAIAIPAIALAVVAAAYAIKLMPDISLMEIAKFGAVAGSIALTAAILAIPAAIVGKLPWPTIIQGFAAMAAGMVLIGIGAATVLGMIAIVAKLGLPPNIADIIGAISMLFLTTAAMIVPAAILGAVLSGPQGAIILAVGAVGFAAIGILAAALVGSVLPAVALLAAVKITDPRTFRMVSGLVIDVLDAVNQFAGSVASIIDAVDPGIYGRLKGETFEGNMKSVNKFIDAMLEGGLVKVIKKIVQMGKDIGASAEEMKGVKMITDVIASVGAFAGVTAAVISALPEPTTFGGDEFGVKMSAASGFLSSIMLAMSQHLAPSLKKIVDVGIAIADPDKALKQMKVVSTAMGVVKTMVDSAVSFKSLISEEGTLPNAADFVNLIQKLMGMFSPYVFQRLNYMATDLMKIEVNKAAMASAGKRLDDMTGFVEQALKAAQKMNTFNDEAAPLKYYQAGASRPTPAVSLVEGLIEEAKALDYAIAGLGDIDLKVRLKQLGDKLGVDAETFTINKEKLNINMNVTVMMDTKELATQIEPFLSSVKTENTKAK